MSKSHDHPVPRRAFLKAATAVAGGLALGKFPAFADPADPARMLYHDGSGMPKRVLGRTGMKVSVVAYPGYAAGRATEEEALASVRHALDEGINYIDVAPAYDDAQRKIGIALQGRARASYHLASKTKERSAAGVRRELEESLRLLKTDHLDVYQMHVVTTKKEVEEILGPGGALEEILKAREEGKLRWVGFSSHSREAAHALLDAHPFDTVMHPVSFVEHYEGGFCADVLEHAKRSGAAVLAIKSMSCGKWPEGMKGRDDWWYRTLQGQEDINRGIQFTLSLDPVCVALPPAVAALTGGAIIAGKNYQPATPADMEAMREMASRYIPIFKKDHESFAGLERDPVYALNPADGSPCGYV